MSLASGSNLDSVSTLSYAINGRKITSRDIEDKAHVLTKDSQKRFTSRYQKVPLIPLLFQNILLHIVASMGWAECRQFSP